MSVRVPENDFYSLHGIWGAYACLALGRIGRGAGIAIGDVRPPAGGLLVGYRSGRGRPRYLPFCPGASAGPGAAAYVGPDGAAKTAAAAADPEPFTAAEIERSLSFSGESWKAGRMALNVVSFFGAVPDPAAATPAELRSRMRPAIYAVLEFDNSGASEALVGWFGLQGVRRPLSDATHGSLAGFAAGTEWGFAALPSEGVDEVMDWSVLDAVAGEDRPLRRLASEGALRFKVPAGAKRRYAVALGVYRDGVRTAGLRAHAYHASLFRDLEEVLETALEESAAVLKRAAALDAELDAAPLSDDRKFLIAHAAHSYNASTELLLAESGEPVFVVNEGEYRMINTLDLTVDQAFWELRYSPWTLRLELDLFRDRSAYEDKWGLAFAHDQGIADCFTPTGTSAYELPRLSECFSFMSYEETLNWSLSACLYAVNAGADGAAWAKRRADDLAACLASLRARDRNGDGIMDVDSDRCAGGAEITTYDSLDVSLGQARNNLYLAVKAWATYVCLESQFGRLFGPASPQARSAGEAAGLTAAAILERVVEPEGYIPAVFESDNRSRIIPAVEGLVYPRFAGAGAALAADGPYADFLAGLKRHLSAVLVDGVCLDPVSGGWKLSSTSRNTWLSKIFLNQYVAEEILGVKDGRTARDAAHAKWQRVGSADWAATDQVDSATGADLGSRLYPRLVTSILWLAPPEFRRAK
jgi:hypothetical protein